MTVRVEGGIITLKRPSAVLVRSHTCSFGLVASKSPVQALKVF